MEHVIELLNDWRPVWLCGAGIYAAWIAVRQVVGMIDELRR